MTRITLLAPSLAAARPLQDALSLRGAPAEVATLGTLVADFGVRRRMDTVVNLTDSRSTPQERLLMADVLAWLGDIGASVVNGLDAFVVGSSTARQHALFAHLGLPHPAARVAGSEAAVPAALAELGLAEQDAEVVAGPPPLVRQRVEATTTLAYVGGRLVAGGPVPETLERAAGEVLGTAGIELGSVSLGDGPDGPRWLAAETGLPADAAVVGAAAEYVLFRAGLA